MKISHTPGVQNFNGFYHILLAEALEKARELSFRDWRCDQTGGCLIFYKNDDYVDVPDLKEIFKLMNLEYPVDGEEKMSTTKVNNTTLCRHIIFITKILSENGIEFNHNIEEYERIKMEAGIQ